MTNFDALWRRAEPCLKRRLKPPLISKPLDEGHWKLVERTARRFIHVYMSSVNPPNLAVCEKYLSAAREDFKAAYLLFQNNHIALTVYHLQQAAEKATKAFCLATGTPTSTGEPVTVESLKKTHRTPQPLLSAVGNELFSDMRDLLGALLGKDYRRMLRDVNALVNSNREEERQLARVPFTSANHVMGIEPLLRTFDALSQSEPFFQKGETLKQVLAECLAEAKDVIIAFPWVKFGSAGIQCYILGAVTFLHESTTRYPGVGGDLDPQDYNDSLGIVKAIPELLKRTPIMIQSVEEMLTSYNSRTGSTSISGQLSSS